MYIPSAVNQVSYIIIVSAQYHLTAIALLLFCTVGIAVDWINDKVYCTVESKIIEFDPSTKSTTDIATLNDDTPRGIGVFPHKNNT